MCLTAGADWQDLLCLLASRCRQLTHFVLKALSCGPTASSKVRFHDVSKDTVKQQSCFGLEVSQKTRIEGKPVWGVEYQGDNATEVLKDVAACLSNRT